WMNSQCFTVKQKLIPERISVMPKWFIEFIDRKFFLIGRDGGISRKETTRKLLKGKPPLIKTENLKLILKRYLNPKELLRISFEDQNRIERLLFSPSMPK